MTTLRIRESGEDTDTVELWLEKDDDGNVCLMESECGYVLLNISPEGLVTMYDSMGDLNWVKQTQKKNGETFLKVSYE